MSGSFEKSVKGGTKIKLAPPKAKYVEHILVATHAGDAGVAEIFRALQNRLRDATWTIVFKALIIVHLMVREGEPNVTLKYLADSPSKLAISNFSDVQVQGTNIRHYYTYILARAKAYRDTKIDWVREGSGRLKRQTIDKGLLRETESVQDQISKLLRCNLLSTEAENEITICAFRLLTMDLLVLYGVMNEGTINVLEHYFEMSKYDAERALTIYKTFTKQTNLVVEFLGTARQYENATRLEIPKLKHAPTSLTSSLEEYLNDPDFEVNRRQYLSQQTARGGRKASAIKDPDKTAFQSQPVNKGSSSSFPNSKAKTPSAGPPSGAPPSKNPAPDLIDFFESIEQNQQPMATQSAPQASYPQQQSQQTGFMPQQAPQQQSQNTGFVLQQAQQPQPTGFTSQQMQPQSSGFPMPQSNGLSQQQMYQPQSGQQIQQHSLTNGFAGNSNPFGQPQYQVSQSTGAGLGDFSGFAQQPFQQHPPLPSNQQQQQQPPHSDAGQQPFSPLQQQINTGVSNQNSNPFRQSMFPQPSGPSSPSYSNFVSATSTGQSSNPFVRNVNGQMTGQGPNPPFQASQPPHAEGTPFSSPPPSMLQQQQQPPVSQLTPQRTGTNPFARTNPQLQSGHVQSQSAAPLLASPTGNNPFRQSQFVNQQTGQGWQAHQGRMGGLEQLDTVPVFPRPPTATAQQSTYQQNFFS